MNMFSIVSLSAGQSSWPVAVEDAEGPIFRMV